MNQEAYKHPVDYIQDELNKLNLRLRYAVQGKQNNDSNNSFSVNNCSNQNIIDLLGDQHTAETYSNKDDILKAINTQNNHIENKLISSNKNYLYPIDLLKQTFRLDSTELDILFICLAPQFDSKYKNIYACLQNDASKIYPTLNLVIELLTDNLQDQSKLRIYFSAQAGLAQWQILKWPENNEEIDLYTPLWIDERIIHYLFGNFFQFNSQIVKHLTVYYPDDKLSEHHLALENLHINHNLKQDLDNWLVAYQSGYYHNHIISFSGPDNGAKEKLLRIIGNSLKQPIIEADFKTIIKDQSVFDRISKLIIREVLLLQGILVVPDLDCLIKEHSTLSHITDSLFKQISNNVALTVLMGDKLSRPRMGRKTIISFDFHFPIPDNCLRKEIWNNILTHHNIDLVNLQPADLAYKFKLTESQIEEAVKRTIDKSILSNNGAGKVNFDNLLIQSCQEQSQHILPELAVKVLSRFSWEDIVIPIDQLCLLKEITYHFKYRQTALNQCGLHKSPLGKGVTVLLSGSSGTGKTLSTQIIANELQLELYKIDLSKIVSKYIGETEKNLDKIFTEAEHSNSILFFDEADAIFGKRSEVKDAHDRYANIEVAYLLQKIEKYDGMTILASNFESNIDKAFKRRFQFIVRYHPPQKEDRRIIWQKAFSEDTPVSQDIDFDFLVDKADFTGANIKNVSIAAACYAANESSEITMEHIMLAMRREYDKIGEHFYERGFYPYYHLAFPEEIQDG